MADWFTKTCRAELGFLVTKYSFRATSSKGTRSAMMSFTRSDAIVNVMSEDGSPPWVTIKADGRTFGLHKYAKAAPRDDSAIAYYARYLRDHIDEVLGHLPRVPPPLPPRRKPRATRAGPIDFLATELGWSTASIRKTVAPKTTTLVFHDDVVRLTIEFVDGTGLGSVRISARSKSVDLDDAIATLAPALVRPREARARLAFYAAFLRARGRALLDGKRSAWSKLRITP